LSAFFYSKKTRLRNGVKRAPQAYLIRTTALEGRLVIESGKSRSDRGADHNKARDSGEKNPRESGEQKEKPNKNQ